MIHKFSIFPLLFLLISCEKENGNKTTADKTDSIAVSEEIKTDVADNQSGVTEKALKEIIFKTDSVKKHLNRKNALALYLKFREETGDLIAKITNDNTYILDNYYTHVSENTQALTLPDSLKTKFRNLEKANIEFWEVGEGYVEIRPKTNYYLQVFDKKLPKDYNEFIKLEALENENLIAADAGLTISFEELSVLVLNWENFLLKYPNSQLYKEVKKNYKNLLETYLFGLDNTPTIEASEEVILKLNPENQKEFERFTSKYPKSTTSKLVLALMDGIKNNLSREDLDKKRDQEFLKYPITK